MLRKFPSGSPADAQTAIWLDLCNPTEDEVAAAETATGLRVPTRDQLGEIENSSRLKVADGVLSMSIPISMPAEADEPAIAPVGFILAQDRLLTIRFAPLQAFEAVALRFDEATPPTSGLEVFIDLCDEIIDRLADALEQAATELRALSAGAFLRASAKSRKATRSNQSLQADLGQIGCLGDRIADARGALLAIGRAVDFACELTSDWFEGRFEPRLRSLRMDVSSLDDYETHLSDKVQFLLDATVGMISIVQNDIFKVLTIVSIVGIPPTLVAGIYGMNFKFMPEYNWALGYPFGLAMIALSAVIPLLWFKWRGWF